MMNWFQSEREKDGMRFDTDFLVLFRESFSSSEQERFFWRISVWSVVI